MKGVKKTIKMKKRIQTIKRLKIFLPFFIDCQNKWGWYPLSCAVKKLRGQSLILQPLIMEILLAFLFILLFYTVGLECFTH